MKRSFFVLAACVAAVAASTTLLAATVSVSSFKGTVYGPGEAALAFTDVDAAQELWVAWDDADKGADISQWKESERLDTIASGTTSASYRLPDDARPGRAARFFLFPAGGTYPLAYIRSTGTQCIDTGVCPDPHTAASMTFLLDDMDTREQCTFGVGDHANGFVFASYVDDSGYWAWSAKDHSGNGASSGNMPLHRRATITLDAHNQLYTLRQEGIADYTCTLTEDASVVGHQTLTSSIPLYLLAYKNLDGSIAGYGRMRVYSASVSLTNEVVRNFAPYVRSGEAGLMDTVHNQFYANGGTGAFIAGGRGDGADGAASDPLDLTTARSEDVFADAYIWMRGMAIDKNGNHILDVGEITNSLHTVALSTGSYGAKDHKPVISNEFVRLPGRGVGRQMQTLYFPQDVVWTNETQTLGYVTPCAVTCGTPLTNFVSHYTWIIRFRPDFSAPVLDTQWLLGFGYGSSRGMMFGLAGTSTEWRKLQIHTYNSSWDLGESFVISNGCGWVDFAVTVDGQMMTAYLVKDGPTTPDGNTDIGLLKRASQTYTNTVDLVPNRGTVLRFGTESAQNGRYPMPAPSSGNHYKCFRGSIQQFACWKRTLSEQEILAALGWPRAETWRVGVENDATTELSADTAPEGGFDVDGVLWPVPNGGLTNGVSVTFKFPIEAGYDDGRAQIFRWKATSDSAEGLLGVAVNGKALGNRPIETGATQSWLVPAAALAVGTNTLTVTRIDCGAGVVTLDAAALGGGWQVGRRNDDWTDFGHEGPVRDEYHVVDGNMRHVPRLMLHTGAGNRTKSREWWHAVMPRSLAGEYDWILHFRTGPDGGGTGTRLCIDLNGERLATEDAPGTKTDHPFAIPRELLKAGENVFSFLNDTQSGTESISIDSVWLEPLAPFNGTFLIVR